MRVTRRNIPVRRVCRYCGEPCRGNCEEATERRRVKNEELVRAEEERRAKLPKFEHKEDKEWKQEIHNLFG